MAWPRTTTANKKLTGLQRQKGGQLMVRCRVAVEPEGVEDDDKLTGWIERALTFVKTLPRK